MIVNTGVWDHLYVMFVLYFIQQASNGSIEVRVLCMITELTYLLPLLH